MEKKWSEKTKLQKISDVVSIVAFCAWMLFEFLDSKGIVGWADIASRIAILILCVFECISFWKEKRIISYIAIGGFICLVATFVLEFMLLAK